MKKVAISFTLILAVCTHFSALSQLDSTRLEAGYLSLKKEFTQSISIKGADLEKMPFTDLADAINAWLYGAYTNSATLSYIVDGNPVSDVNTYSIHDIDEIVLVQNATTLVGAINQQELVLITTKRGGKGRFGLTAAAQTGLVNTDFGNEGGAKSHTGLYHNYFIRAYQNLSTIRFGISANYQRDIWPSPMDGKVHVTTPYNLQRWRLNGFFTWQLGKKNRIDILANYSPQMMDSSLSTTLPGAPDVSIMHSHQHSIVPQLRWHSDLGGGWSNDLLGVYLSERANLDARMGDTSSIFNLPQNQSLYLANATSGVDHIFVRDRLVYTAVAGNWIIQPALNVSYEHIRQNEHEANYNYSGGTGLPSFPTGNDFSEARKAGVYFLTPSIDATYGHGLDIQAGVVMNASYSSMHGIPRWFPFASLSYDLLRFSDPTSAASLKVYGSYARRTAISVNDYGLTDLSSGPGFFISSQGLPTSFTTGFYPIATTGTIPGAPATPAYWVWETGVTWSAAEDRVQLSYNFERRNSVVFGFIVDPVTGLPIYVEPEIKSSLHHLNIMARLVERTAITWRSGINVTLLRNSLDSMGANFVNASEGDAPNAPSSWTGGWVNRMDYKDLSFGLDLLYHFHETPVGNPVEASKVNSILLQNIYAGYHWRLSHNHSLGLFLESRGLLRSHSSNLPDLRRYYTIGGAWSL